jgi:amino-acid N-acetyltransferase
MNKNSIEFHFAKPENIGDLQQLLKSADLPCTDIEKHIHNFVFIKDGPVFIGCAALEIYGDLALLRSVAVHEKYRSQGIGKVLVNEILRFGNSHQIKKFYLLTTKAEAFFKNLGFEVIDRNAAPKRIQETIEFSSICPESSVLMLKELR